MERVGGGIGGEVEEDCGVHVRLRTLMGKHGY